MKRAAFFLIAAATVLTAGQAAADPPPPKPQGGASGAMADVLTPPTPAQIAAERARADQLIAQTPGGAAALENVSTEGRSAVIRHRPSGAYCAFIDAPGAQIVLGDHDALACREPLTYWIDLVQADHAAPGATAKSELAAMVAEQLTRHPGWTRIARPPSLFPIPPGIAPAPDDPQAWIGAPDASNDMLLMARVANGWLYRAMVVGQPKVMMFMEAAIGDFTIDNMVHDPQVAPKDRPPDTHTP